jgi:ADP-ribose pyrophosphatase YjhB (NUDIX family)
MTDTSQEFFDIVDENDNLLGIIKPRDLVHREMTDWHRVSAVFILNDKIQLLSQQRSIKKDAEPGVWHCFFGGHLKSGEEYKQSAIEEVREEIGLEIPYDELIHLGQGINSENKHHAGMFLYRWNGTSSDLHFNDGEVEQVQWMEIKDYAEMKKTQGTTKFMYNENLIRFLNKSKLIPPHGEVQISESAGGIVINDKGKVAIVSQHGISWSLPKGTVDQGEEILEAAKREITEETGISDLNLIKSLGSFSRSGISRYGNKYSKTIHIFLFKTNQKELHPIDPDNPEAIWLSKEEVVAKLSYSEDREFFNSVIRQIVL